jgi:hypothetical protein
MRIPLWGKWGLIYHHVLGVMLSLDLPAVSTRTFVLSRGQPLMVGPFFSSYYLLFKGSEL